MNNSKIKDITLKSQRLISRNVKIRMRKITLIKIMAIIVFYCKIN